jgi:SAM-dependent methyltransferase
LNGTVETVGASVIERYPPQKAQIYGEDAALYDRFRPSYPRELMEAIVAETTNLPVLEIGAGTGKATRALLALGKAVHVLEPDRRMASVLEGSCAGGPVEVENVGLEAANLAPGSYDLVVAAQSWHWVDRELAYDQVADALVEGGVLALIWHRPSPEQGIFGAALSQLYRRLAPNVLDPFPGAGGADFDPATEPFAATKRFRTWSRLEHRWQRHLDAAGLVGWLCSGSDHRVLGVDERSELMTGIAALVAEFDHQVTINMTTIAHLAYRV